MHGQAVSRVRHGHELHLRVLVQQAPVAAPAHLHRQDLEQKLGVLFAGAAPRASAEGQEVEGVLAWGSLPEFPALGLEPVGAAEEVGEGLGLPDAVHHRPPLRHLVALLRSCKGKKDEGKELWCSVNETELLRKKKV